MSKPELSKKTLVFGASANPTRYSYMAIKMLKDYNHHVVAIGRKEQKVMDVQIQNGHPILSNIDTITLYMNPVNLEKHVDYLIKLRPRRIIFNPGTESLILKKLFNNQGISTLNACTLVLLRTNQY